MHELASNIRRYEEENPEGTLADFLEEISLITDIDNYDNEADSVVLMTIHSAKGLEFPVVFLPGMEENIFPGMASIYNPAEVEEERRLAYVAITRAKEEPLHIPRGVAHDFRHDEPQPALPLCRGDPGIARDAYALARIQRAADRDAELCRRQALRYAEALVRRRSRRLHRKAARRTGPPPAPIASAIRSRTRPSVSA